MGGRGANSGTKSRAVSHDGGSDQTKGKYDTAKTFIRFGDYSDYSINYLALTLEENEDLTYELENGTPLLAAIAKSVNGYGNRDIFEEGVSVFKSDANGMPIIENLQQYNSLLSRINNKAYILDATKKGTGADGEPVVSNIKSKTEAKYSNAKLISHIEKTLSQNYGKSTTAKEPNFASKEYVIFNGKKYTNPKWSTKTGYGAYKKKDSGLRLTGGTKVEEKPLSSFAKNVTKFTSKSGKDMVRYDYEGKSYTDTPEKFASRTVRVETIEPYRVVKKKKA